MTNTITPHVLRALQGKKLKDLSFIEHPPQHWSWAIATSLMSALLDEKTKKHWSSHSDMPIKDVGHLLGETWIRRSLANFQPYPDIFPHATAIFEALFLKSQDALTRLYGQEGPKIAHSVAAGLHHEGQKVYKGWLNAYFDMRQSIEVDDAIQARIIENVRNYPQGWSVDKEKQFYNQNLLNEHWPILASHSPVELTVPWFNPATMSEYPVHTTIHCLDTDGTSIDHVHGQSYDAVLLTKQGRIELDAPMGQRHSIDYGLQMSFAHHAVANCRPLHLHVNIPSSVQLSDDPTLQNVHAMQLAHAITRTISFWLNNPLIQERVKRTHFEPSMSMDCQLKDPLANTLFNDVVQQHLQQYMVDTFNVPEDVNTMPQAM